MYVFLGKWILRGVIGSQSFQNKQYVVELYPSLAELTLAELKVSQGWLPRVIQGQANEEKRPINSSGNKRAYEVGKTKTR